MLEQFFPGIVMASQLFLAGDLVVDRVVAFSAEVQPGLHLRAGEAFLEPLIAVQGAGDEMVKVMRCCTAA